MHGICTRACKKKKNKQEIRTWDFHRQLPKQQRRPVVTIGSRAYLAVSAVLQTHVISSRLPSCRYITKLQCLISVSAQKHHFWTLTSLLCPESEKKLADSNAYSLCSTGTRKVGQKRVWYTFSSNDLCLVVTIQGQTLKVQLNFIFIHIFEME
jgi:hypothetical protein